MNNIFQLIERNNDLFYEDVSNVENDIISLVNTSSFLVIGGAGSIGQAVVKEIFSRNPKRLYVVDISENNLVELVRDLRSSFGYISGEFKTFAIDCGSIEFEYLIENNGPFDYVLNLSALKHVRSEKDPYTLMRMIDVNILNTIKTIDLAIKTGTKKYFCVSTDKAANPVNMMGASKRIMEMFLIDNGKEIPISTARFANVAFSDGSLLHSFNQRFNKKQPIAAPNDIKRYFVTPKEAGELCLMSVLFGDNRDIYFPKLNKDINLITFSSIAIKFLQEKGFEPYICNSEDEAREKIDFLYFEKKWPCIFSKSDTTGEKAFEEFFTNNETIDLNNYNGIGIVKNSNLKNEKELDNFINEINKMKKTMSWNKKQIVDLFEKMIPGFYHNEKDKNLDNKM